jgi:hypothetical protein
LDIPEDIFRDSWELMYLFRAVEFMKIHSS